MRILLDTHILLWAISNDERLSDKARRFILHPDNEICYSVLSLWEVELKRIAHPKEMPVSAASLARYCRAAGYRQVSLLERHIELLESLGREEGAPEHKDPFDRMLICQASGENMILLTHDHRIAEYTEPCIMMV